MTKLWLRCGFQCGSCSVCGHCRLIVSGTHPPTHPSSPFTPLLPHSTHSLLLGCSEVFCLWEGPVTPALPPTTPHSIHSLRPFSWAALRLWFYCRRVRSGSPWDLACVHILPHMSLTQKDASECPLLTPPLVSSLVCLLPTITVHKRVSSGF